jgi:hypothetical protein
MDEPAAPRQAQARAVDYVALALGALLLVLCLVMCYCVVQLHRLDQASRKRLKSAFV